VPPEETATAIDISKPSPKKPVVLKTKTTLPAPKNNTRSFTGKSVAKFFEWYESFSPQQAAVADLKVYRKYPVIDQVLVGLKYKNRIDGIEGPMPFKAEDYESHFLHHYGSGRYMCIMNEKGVPGIVASCEFKVEDEMYPPRVDYNVLVRGEPENQGYIDGLKARGVKLPWDTGEAAEEKEDVTVVTQLADAVMRKAERAEDENKELRDELMQVTKEASSPTSTATNESIRMVADTAKQTNAMMAGFVERIAQASAPNYNPLEMVKTISELTNPKGDNGLGLATLVSNIMQQSQAAMQQMHHETLEFMRQERTQPAAATEPTGDPIDMILERSEKFDRLRNALGAGRRENSEPREPNGKGWMQALMENPKVVESIGLVGQLALTMLMRMNGTPAPAVAPNPQPAVQPTQPVTTKPAEPQPDQQTLAFQGYIEKPFLAHFFGEASGLTGYTFAAALQAEMMDIITEPEIVEALKVRPVMQSGRVNYETIRDKWGRKKLDEVIRAAPNIWNSVQGNVRKYSQFLDEFFNYDR
jgi:hypothetical protein